MTENHQKGIWDENYQSLQYILFLKNYFLTPDWLRPAKATKHIYVMKIVAQIFPLGEKNYHAAMAMGICQARILMHNTSCYSTIFHQTHCVFASRDKGHPTVNAYSHTLPHCETFESLDQSTTLFAVTLQLIGRDMKQIYQTIIRRSG